MTDTVPTEHIDESISRIVRIAWNQNDSDEREGSQIALMREFLRRMALWARVLDAEEEWPFFNVANRLRLRSVAVKERLEAFDFSRLEGALARLPYYPRNCCLWYAQWCAIEDLQAVTAFELPEPYEPVVLTFERGGRFRVENRMFQFGVASFPFGTVPVLVSEPPVTALDADSLARWDSTWAAETARLQRRS